MRGRSSGDDRTIPRGSIARFKLGALASGAAFEKKMSTRLYVGNLSFHSTTEAVRSAFAAQGDVTDVHVVTDRSTGQSRGFAFVTMATEAQAQSAIAAMNGA